MKTSAFDYFLPDELIARYPANPKSLARLLVYDRALNKTIHATIADINEFLPKDTALIFNDTKVMKARIFGAKSSGAKSEILYLAPLTSDLHSVMIRGKVKEGSEITLNSGVILKVIKLLDDGSREVLFLKGDKRLDFNEISRFLELHGEIPLPPYMARSAEAGDERDYQTSFAKNLGSIAAPTASLHFSDEAFSVFVHKYSHAFVTLHVGAGTFKPIDAKNILEHKMHFESFEISNAAQELINSNAIITAFGTTACRAIESFVRGAHGKTNLFLHPQNKPIRVNHLLTNFHLPKSTLITLVSSFVGVDKTMELYAEAVMLKYRFYSYGDAMLII